MKLRERILILLFLSFCGYLGLEYAIHSWVVSPMLEQQEYTTARQQVQKCGKILNDQARDLQTIAEQFSGRSDLHAILRQSVLPEGLSEKVDMVCLSDGGDTWNAFAVRRGSVIPDAKDFLNTLQKGRFPVITKTALGNSYKGIATSTAGPLLIGICPYTISQAGSSRPAMLIVGRFITPEFIAGLRRQVYINFTCIPYTPQRAATLTQQANNGADISGDGFFYQKLGEDLLQSYSLMSDITGKPALFLRTDVPQEFSRDSQRILYMAGYIRLAAMLPAIVILTIIFQMAVVEPLLRLMQDIIAIGRGRFVRNPRCSVERRNEIGVLAYEFDRMLERLDAAQKKLVEKSFVSGMAEMSSGILHNARNALSPVVFTIERMGEKITAMDSPELQQAIQEVEHGNTDPQRKADLQRFLLLSMRDQRQFLYETHQNLDDLARQVYQIEGILNGQHSFGGAAKPLENIALKQLVEEAVELVPANLRSRVQISVDSKIEQLRPIHVHRVVFLQVLENLLVNAAESLVRGKPLYSKIKLSAEVEPIDNIEMLHLQIEDNGVGIEPEMMKKLFGRGVSSKTHGMTGIGLHWCANTVAAMNGRIWAESNGNNQGACFHIVMPVWQDKESLIVNEKG
jgi:signal transduction histidine kinase